MSLNETVSAERLHIGFFGMCNAGKSSVVNAVTGQNLSIISDLKGTTTDPVRKAMELSPLGPVVIVDTPGIDDDGTLGDLRIKKSLEVLKKVNIAVLVVDVLKGLSEQDKKLIDAFKEQNLSYIIAWNKADLLENCPENSSTGIYISAGTGKNINALKEKIASFSKNESEDKRIVGDLLSPGEIVILVTPIDKGAPKGRLILPQQQTIRDILDADCIAMVVTENELPDALKKVTPRMVITDSKIFGMVDKIVPQEIPLTSFSILFARYKGELKALVSGAAKLKSLKDGDKVLISEGCTHHRQCGDIGSVKMPEWIKNYSRADVDFSFTSGGDFPQDLSEYSLVVHCGGCMLTEKEMKNRIKSAEENNVPIVNYGIAIACMHGMLKRSLELFPEVS